MPVRGHVGDQFVLGSVRLVARVAKSTVSRLQDEAPGRVAVRGDGRVASLNREECKSGDGEGGDRGGDGEFISRPVPKTLASAIGPRRRRRRTGRSSNSLYSDARSRKVLACMLPALLTLPAIQICGHQYHQLRTGTRICTDCRSKGRRQDSAVPRSLIDH